MNLFLKLVVATVLVVCFVMSVVLVTSLFATTLFWKLTFASILSFTIGQYTDTFRAPFQWLVVKLVIST
jgi:hypothetical protein